jgi:hypothetical protein
MENPDSTYLLLRGKSLTTKLLYQKKRRIKRAKFRELIRSHKLEFLALQEVKMEVLDKKKYVC